MHDHHHHHHEASEISGVKLFLTIALNLVIAVVEIIGGFFAGSLSLISDALHNLSDGMALVLSFLAIRIAGKANDEHRTFGYKRASILAAFINSAALIGISLFLFREAYDKFFSRQAINGSVVIGVALVGLIANFLGVLLLKKNAAENLNLRAAYFHLLSDTLSSIAVILGGWAILVFKAYWIDPVLTVLISVYVLKESFEILRQTVNVLMQGVPAHLELGDVVAAVAEIPGVKRVHHVHLWNMDEKNLLFEAHLDVDDMMVSQAEMLGTEIERKLHDRFEINHTTLQFECTGCRDCDLIDGQCCREV